MSAISIFAPAKLNLYLAITGRRSDGFHDLVSVAAPLTFGDTLEVEPAEAFSLACDDPELPVNETNLVLKAAHAYAAAAARPTGGARFFLRKRVPVGAGLGGGSSDAVAALQALDSMAKPRLGPAALMEIAAQVGSDCPLFLQGGPVIMRGRGERVEALPPAAVQRLRGRRVLIFKPGFGVATASAYARLAAAAAGGAAANGVGYMPPEEAETRLTRWLGDASAPLEALLLNNMEPPVFAKYVALPILLAELRDRFGLAARMSGSGSACFALLADDTPIDLIVAAIRAAWGNSSLVLETELA